MMDEAWLRGIIHDTLRSVSQYDWAPEGMERQPWGVRGEYVETRRFDELEDLIVEQILNP